MAPPKHINQTTSKSVGFICGRAPKSSYGQQSLPSFSEFLSFTFPGIPRKICKEKSQQVQRLTKIHSVSHKSSPKNGYPAINSVYKDGKFTEFKDEAERMRSPIDVDTEDRTSFKGVHSHRDDSILGEHTLKQVKLPSNEAMLKYVSTPYQVALSSEKRKVSLSNANSSYHPRPTRLHGNGEPQPKKRKTFRRQIRSYKCSFCYMVFSYQKHLIAHVKEKHENQKPFACPRDECRQRFGGLGDVNRHVKTVHEGEKRFSCHLCERCFSRRSGVKRHMFYIHKAARA